MISQCNANRSQTAFGRNFYASEITKIKKGKLNAAFELGMAIGRDELKSKDGARQDLAVHEVHFKMASAKKGNHALEIAKELYFKLFEAEKGFEPRYRYPADGLTNHELHSVSIGHIPTLVDLGVRFGQGVIIPERVMSQLSAHKAAHGTNKHLKMFERHIQGLVAPKTMTPFERSVDVVIATPIRALTDGFKKIFPKPLDPEVGAEAFERAFAPQHSSVFAPKSPQSKAFAQAFDPKNKGAL